LVRVRERLVLVQCHGVVEIFLDLWNAKKNKINNDKEGRNRKRKRRRRGGGGGEWERE
jgi:hypothetical protein